MSQTILLKLSSIFKILANRLLPANCLICGCLSRSSRNICAECELDLPRMPAHCVSCGQFITIENIRTICGSCISNPPPCSRTFALFPYETPITQLIIALKFQQQLSHAKLFGNILAERIQKNWYANKPYPDLIIPVPLHPHRLSERGFNQALEIARPIAKLLGLTIDITGSRRIKPTLAQSSLTLTKRKENMTRAFSVNRNYSGMHLVIIDDVMTTGCTMFELAEALKDRGAKQIDLWCIARRG